jgi:hypothetical protein
MEPRGEVITALLAGLLFNYVIGRRVSNAHSEDRSPCVSLAIQSAT